MLRTPRACGARNGECVACFSGTARKTRHTLTQKAREAGQGSAKNENSEEIHKRLMQLEARLIEGAVEESPSRKWGRGSENEAALCPKCAISLQARGQQKRILQGNGGESVTISRTYGVCLKCGESLFPPR